MRNKPSRTAVKIGHAVVFEAYDETIASILPAGLAEMTERLLFAVNALKPWHMKMVRAAWYRRFVRGLEKRTVNGQFLHAAIRKCFMDAETRDAIAAGARQVLVVGAGLDTLALRLAPEFPDVTFVEIDHPATQGLKRKAVEKIGGAAGNLRFLGVDLAKKSLREALAGLDAWQQDATSVVVAEGLLMYLREAAVRAFFDGVRESSGPGSRVAFSHMRLDKKGRPFLGEKMAEYSRWGLRLIGEPILWGVDKPARFLESLGYALGEPPERYDLRQRFLLPNGVDRQLGGIEFVAVAERQDAG
jgi:methyltransferase (TIGR00027 family)